MASKESEHDSLNVEFFANLVRAETRLYNHLNDELRAACGIVTSQYEFLCYLRDHERPRLADMSVEFAIGVGAVSKAMVRLETLGLISRTANPDDRRAAILALTAEGTALLSAADATFREQLNTILTGAMTRRELAGAASALASLRGALERAGRGVPAG